MAKVINYNELLNSILTNLSERERDVLIKRNALLNTPKQTLEEIGENYKITRERVRQIENEGIKKIKRIDANEVLVSLKSLENNIREFLTQYGGFLAENHLISLLITDEQMQEEINALNFILDNLMSDKFDQVDDIDVFETVWKLEQVDLDNFGEVAEAIKAIIDGKKQPLAIADLLDSIKNTPHYNKIDTVAGDNEKILESLLNAHTDIDQNILGLWGSKDWETIKPKRMTDKAYLILLREQKPLHFKEVADLINQAKFDHKVACPATVHNELILDDKYVLVGRGIYALKDWGYEEGTVSDIITRILKEKGSLDKKELINEVLKQRVVQKTTIILSLMNKDKFTRTEDGKYQLA